MTNYYIHGKNPVTGGLKNCRRYLEKAKKFGKEQKYISGLGTCSDGDFVMFKSFVRPSIKNSRVNRMSPSTVPNERCVPSRIVAPSLGK